MINVIDIRGNSYDIILKAIFLLLLCISVFTEQEIGKNSPSREMGNFPTGSKATGQSSEVEERQTGFFFGGGRNK